MSQHTFTVREALEKREKSGLTFVICGEGETGHRLQAVGATHHQRTGASFRLGGTGQGSRAKAAVGQKRGGYRIIKNPTIQD